jgi:hypothetical protein
VKKITRSDEDNNVYESDVNLGDVHDAVESVENELSEVKQWLKYLISVVAWLGSIITLILLAHTIRHW